MNDVVIRYPVMSRSPNDVPLWEALLLGGFVRSIKDAKLAVRSGTLSLDGVKIIGLDHRIHMGQWYELSFRKPSGRIFRVRIVVRDKWRM